MELILADDYEHMSRLATSFVTSQLQLTPSASLGLTTGNTPMGLYRNLVTVHQDGHIQLNAARVFCLEEYWGIRPDDERSLFAWLNRSIIAPCGIPSENVFRLHGEDENSEQMCRDFEKAIYDRGGLDLIVEGIGTNAHVGFNEPGSQRDSRTRIVQLNGSTIDYNYHYWNKEVTSYGLTAGIATLVEAKQILIMASGKNKAEALASALEQEISPDRPVSFLRLNPKLTVIADRDAASLLTPKEDSCEFR